MPAPRRATAPGRPGAGRKGAPGKAQSDRTTACREILGAATHVGIVVSTETIRPLWGDDAAIDQLTVDLAVRFGLDPNRAEIEFYAWRTDGSPTDEPASRVAVMVKERSLAEECLRRCAGVAR